MDFSKVRSGLERRGFKVYIASDKEEAKAIVMKELLKGVKTLGKGGSNTLKETGIWDELVRRDALEGDDRIELFATTLYKMKGLDPDIALKKGKTADAYICSANAVSEDGTIYNIDGIGNRVGSIIYGPDKVIMVVGKNKIYPDPETAWKQLKNVTCVKHAKRNDAGTPCTVLDRCTMCISPKMECKVTSVLSYALPGREYHIVLVDEILGY